MLQNTKIQVGYLFKIITDTFKDSGSNEYSTTKELIEISIPKGTIIEIRYPFSWHFRANKKYKHTYQNIWGHATENHIIENCQLIGKVNNFVMSKNQHDLPEILEQSLYNKYENGTFINMPESAYLYLFQQKLNSALSNYDEFRATNRFDIKAYLENSLTDIYNISKEFELKNVLSKFKELNDLYGTSFHCA